MVEVTLLEAVVWLFVAVVYLLEVEFVVMIRIILESVLIAIEPITPLTNIESCMANLLGLLKLIICFVLLDHLLHMTLVLLVFLLTNLWLSKWFSDSKNTFSLSSNISTMAHSGISYLWSSSLHLGSLILVVNPQTGNYNIFHFSHIFCLFYSFIGTVNLTSSLALTNVNYISFVSLILYLSYLSKAF